MTNKSQNIQVPKWKCKEGGNRTFSQLFCCKREHFLPFGVCFISSSDSINSTKQGRQYRHILQTDEGGLRDVITLSRPIQPGAEVEANSYCPQSSTTSLLLCISQHCPQHAWTQPETRRQFRIIQMEFSQKQTKDLQKFRYQGSSI